MSTEFTVAERARAALLRIDRSAALGIAVLAVLAVAATVVFVGQHRPREVAFSGDGSPVAVVGASSTASPPTAAGSASGAAGEVVVDVAGRVREPGLVRVPAGSRVADVIAAAGGFTRSKDAVSVNQARIVSDGEQIVVGGGGAVAAGGGAGAGGTSSGGMGSGGAPARPVDLNSATLAELETLPGVGPVLAQRIVDHRTSNGRFTSVDELRDVSGIGDKTFTDLAPRVRV